MKQHLAVIGRIMPMILLTLLIGCGNGGGTTSATGARRFGSLEFKLTTPKTTYALGEQVSFAFSARNVGAQAVQTNADGCDRAFYVTQGGTRIAGVTGCASQDFASSTIAPGDAKTNNFTWDQKDFQGNQVPPGQYAIVGWLDVVSIDGTLVSTDQARQNLASNPIQVTIGP